MLTKEQVRDVLLAGEPVVDIGQIDKPTKRILSGWVAQGLVLAGWNHDFPIRKRAWLLKGAEAAVAPLQFMTAQELQAFTARFGSPEREAA